MTDRGSEVHEDKIGGLQAMARQTSRVFQNGEVQARKVERIVEISLRHNPSRERSSVSQAAWFMSDMLTPVA